MEPRKEPNFPQRLLLLVSKILPSHGFGLLFGSISIIARRIFMQQINLYAVPLPPSDPVPTPPDHRTPSGFGNDPDHPHAGSTFTPFGRNMPPAQPKAYPDLPSVQVVAQRLLARKGGFKPAGEQFNVLAAAWVQAMTHDWFGHADSGETVELAEGPPGCPLSTFRFKKTKRRADGFHDNTRTHWWDASFLYGQDDEAVKRCRTGIGGKLHLSSEVGLLAKDDDGNNLVGDAKNAWLGVAMLQEIFAREHNAVCDAVVTQHPELKDDDEKLFNVARLVVAAVAAKIHTVDWTVELLKTDTLEIGMYVLGRMWSHFLGCSLLTVH